MKALVFSIAGTALISTSLIAQSPRLTISDETEITAGRAVRITSKTTVILEATTGFETVSQAVPEQAPVSVPQQVSDGQGRSMSLPSKTDVTAALKQGQPEEKNSIVGSRVLSQTQATGTVTACPVGNDVSFGNSIRAENFVGVWTGSGKLMFPGDYQVKLKLNADKTCLLEYSDREPAHTLNPYPKTQKIIVTGPWRIKSEQAEDHIQIEAKISEWTETTSGEGGNPSTSKIKSKPLVDGIYFAIQPDGTLKRAMLRFTGEGLLPGIPVEVQAVGANLTKQIAP